MTYSSCSNGSNSSLSVFKLFFLTLFCFPIYDLWILTKYAFTFFDEVDRFQLVSLTFLNSGKRVMLKALHITGKSNLFVGCDHFWVFTYCEWSLQSLAYCFPWQFSLILTFLPFPSWLLYCLILTWRYGSPSKVICRLLPFWILGKPLGCFWKQHLQV